jgi:hypothetical protein
MGSNIVSMPATTTMTAEMALKSALDLDLTDVLIAGYDQDGALVVRSSRLLCSDALWLAEKMREYALNGGQL